MTGGPLRATTAALRRFRMLRGGFARKSPSLHPKHGNRLFYKGYGAKPMGHYTRRGGYILDWTNRVPEFVIPEFADCHLKPYVSTRTPKVTVPPPPDSVGTRRRS